MSVNKIAVITRLYISYYVIPHCVLFFYLKKKKKIENCFKSTVVVQGVGKKQQLSRFFLSITILEITTLQNVEDPVTVLKKVGEMRNPV